MITTNTLSLSDADDIFRICFPTLNMPCRVFGELLGFEECSIFTYNENGKLVGFSAVKGDCIRLLCVLPEYRLRGIASALLRHSESFIKENGFKTAVLGGFDSELFIGAVTERSEWDTHDNAFFRKQGYSAKSGCIEMKLTLADYTMDNSVFEVPDGVKIEFYSGNKNALLEAVALVDEEWVQYFRYDVHVMTAIEHGKVVSFAIVGDDEDNILSAPSKKIGSVGCVGTIPQARKRGLGLAVVAKATEFLKEKGCDESFIHFTYLEDWYGKFGYRTFMCFWFGRKSLI